MNRFLTMRFPSIKACMLVEIILLGLGTLG